MTAQCSIRRLRCCARRPRFVAAASGAAYNEIAAWRERRRAGARCGVMPHVRRPRRRGAARHADEVRCWRWHCRLAGHVFVGRLRCGAQPAADFHVYIGAYACNGVKRTAHAVLPIGLPPGNRRHVSMNIDGNGADVLAAGTKLPGDARAGWRVLRALVRDARTGGIRRSPSSSELRADDCNGALAAKSAVPAEESDRVASTHSRRPSASGLARPRRPRFRCIAATLSCAAAEVAAGITRSTGSAAVGLNPEDALALGLATRCAMRA